MSRAQRELLVGVVLFGFSLSFFTYVDEGEYYLGSPVQLFLCGLGLFIIWRGWSNVRASRAEAEGEGSSSPVAAALLAFFVAGLVGRIAHTQLYPTVSGVVDRMVEQSNEKARRVAQRKIDARLAERQPPPAPAGWSEEERATVTKMFREALTVQIQADFSRFGEEADAAEIAEMAGVLATCMAGKQEARFPNFKAYTERRRTSRDEAVRLAGDGARDWAECQDVYEAELDEQRKERLASAGRDPATVYSSEDLFELGVTDDDNPVAYAVHVSSIVASSPGTRRAWLRTGHAQDKTVPYADALALWEFRCEGHLRYRVLQM